MSRRTHAAAGGFSLLELILVVSLIAILAGALTPSIGALMRSQSRTATLEEMGLLSEGVVAYYADTGQFPGDVVDLMGDSVAGWSGPYLHGSVDDPWSGASGYAVDAFGNAYRLTTNGFTLTITSDGADRAAATADDLTLDVSVVPVLRKETLEELATINAAIVQYNAVNLATNPLPANWASARGMLESNGFLPVGGGFENDAWGDVYQADPAGVSPLARVRSVNVGS